MASTVKKKTSTKSKAVTKRVKKNAPAKKKNTTKRSRRTKKTVSRFSKFSRHFLLAALILLVCGIVYFSGIPTAVEKIILPFPKIEQVDVDNVIPTLKKMDYSYAVTAHIVNNGRGGDVVFEANLSQGKKHWTKQLRRTMKAGEAADFEIIFAEVTFDGEKPNLNFRAFGKLF